MTEVLSQAGLPTDAAFTIREHFNFTPGAKSIAEVRTYDVKDEGCCVRTRLGFVLGYY